MKTSTENNCFLKGIYISLDAWQSVYLMQEKKELDWIMVQAPCPPVSKTIHKHIKEFFDFLCQGFP